MFTTPISVTAHFHIVMGLSAIFGMFAGVYHWFPKMYGRMMNRGLGYAHFWITFIAAYGVFYPMHFLGLAGLPRRYYSNTAFPMFDGLVEINELISVFAILGVVAQLLFFLISFIAFLEEEKHHKTHGALTLWSGLLL